MCNPLGYEAYQAYLHVMCFLCHVLQSPLRYLGKGHL
ncbi:hypothetical protein [Brochothrix phage ADU4]|nr:hypothetical protein [Brochothrix phage ADU4]